MLFLQPFIQPAEEGALPEHAILWLQYPVVLIRIDEEFGWNTTHAGCIEGTHTLVGIDAVILFAVDAENWSCLLYTSDAADERTTV